MEKTEKQTTPKKKLSWVQKKFIASMEEMNKKLSPTEIPVDLAHVNGEFVSDATKFLFTFYQRGHQDRIKEEPGAYILTKIVEDGLQFSDNPRLMFEHKHMKVAIKTMEKEHPGEYVPLFMNKASAQKLATRFGWQNFEKINIVIRPKSSN